MNKKTVKKSFVILGTASMLTFSSINLPINTDNNFTSIVHASNVSKGVKILIDKQEIKSDLAPIIKNGRTLVPVRVVSENLGFDVEWDQKNWTAILSKDGIDYRVKIGEKKIRTSDGKEMKLDVPAQLVNKRTMLPLRAIVEISGASVEWDSNSKSVLVNSTGGPIEKPVVKEEVYITEASYNGKTIKINNKSWKVKNGDVWVIHEGPNANTASIEEVMDGPSFGDYSLSGDLKLRHSDTRKRVEYQLTDTELNLSDIVRKTGGSATISGNKFVIDRYASQDKVDRRKQGAKESHARDDKFAEETAHIPTENEASRRFEKMVEVKAPRNLGFELIEVRPYTKKSLKNIKYAVEDVGLASHAPKIVKNAGALKAGDLFAVGSPEASPSMGFKKGYYIMKIPTNAKAIHPSGDLRYGWTDSRYDDYAVKLVNAMRSNDSDYMRDQTKRLPSVSLTSPVNTQMQWHKDQVIKQYGMKPQAYGFHGSKETGHYQGGDARMEVLGHINRGVANYYKSSNGQYKKYAGVSNFTSSGAHMGVIMDKRYTTMSVQNIFRPDLTEVTVMTFGK